MIVNGHCYLNEGFCGRGNGDSSITSCVSSFSFSVVAMDETISKLEELRML